jgi:surface-anchored protein
VIGCPFAFALPATLESSLMLLRRVLVATTVLALPAVAGAEVITSGHLDLDIDYLDGQLTLTWRTYNPMSAGTPVNTDDHPLAGNPARVPLANRYTVPGSASFACLGAPGDTVYRLKQAQDLEQVWLGYNTQNVPAGALVGDKVQLELVGVVGAPAGGRFVAYTTNAVGTPTYLFNSTTGSCAVSSFPGGGITTNVHNHAWWAFSAPGTYTLRFVASATRTAGSGGGTATTGPVDVTFEVE